jgi:Na+-driven multidrug efflux pump
MGRSEVCCVDRRRSWTSTGGTRRTWQRQRRRRVDEEAGTTDIADAVMGIKNATVASAAAADTTLEQQLVSLTAVQVTPSCHEEGGVVERKNADPQQKHVYDDPSYKTLLIFAMTTVIIWLSEPLLSLVDTTVVGWSGTTSAAAAGGSSSTANVVTQLASLGPATTLIDSLLYGTYGLSIATTNRIAAEQAVDNNERQLQTTVSHVLGISVLLGSLCTLLCWIYATPILTKMAGGSGTVELLRYATFYTKIRSAVAVAAVGGLTLQSICLAQRDVRTPALAVLAASVTNLVGDLALRRHGVVGAASATAAASLVSAAILFQSVRRQFLSWRAKDAVTDTAIPLVSLPDRHAAWQLLKLAGPYVNSLSSCLLYRYPIHSLIVAAVLFALIMVCALSEYSLSLLPRYSATAP